MIKNVDWGRWNSHKYIYRAAEIRRIQVEETWKNVDEVLRTALDLGLELLEKEAGIPPPNQLASGD